MIAAIVGPALIVAAWLIFGLVAQRWFVFPGRLIPESRVDPRQFDPSIEVWHLQTDAGPVEAWYLPAKDGAGEGQPSAPGPAVIFAHGNGELIDNWLGLLDPYRAMGAAVLLVEFRGYGRSPGKPTQRRLTDDFIAAYDRLMARAEIDGDRVVFHGRSIGGGVACALAAERKARALVLQSTFTHMGAMALRFWYPPWLMRDRFDNAAFLAQYEGPVLLMHGRGDTLIPVSHALRLNRIAHRGELLLVDSNHNDFPVDKPEVWAGVERFLRQAGVVE